MKPKLAVATHPDSVGTQVRAGNSNGKSAFFWWAIPVCLAALVRLPALRAVAPFIDESGHLYASTHYSFLPLFRRLQEGKALGYFFFYPLTFFPDPLLAARVFMALLGVLTTYGIFSLTRYLGTVRAACYASTLWALMPFVVFHDRLALHDPIAVFLAVSSLVVWMMAVSRRSLVTAVAGGSLLGFSMLTKANTFVVSAWVLLLAGLVLKTTDWKWRFKAVGAYATGAGLILSPMIFAIWRNSSSTNQFVRSASDGPLWTTVWSNALKVTAWITGYDSIWFILLAVLVLLTLLRSKLHFALAASFVFTTALFCVLFREWFPRYYLIAIVPLCLLAGVVTAEWETSIRIAWTRRLRRPNDWSALGRTIGLCGLAAASIWSWAANDFRISSTPLAASLPDVDRFQYLTGWPSAHGLDQLLPELNRVAPLPGPRPLLLTGGFGNHGWWSLPLVGKLNPRLEIRQLEIGNRELLLQAIREAHERPVYILAEPPHYTIPADLWQSVIPAPKLLARYVRPSTEGGFQLFSLDTRSAIGIRGADGSFQANDAPTIESIATPNGIESDKGVRFFWLGGGAAKLAVYAPADGEALMRGTIWPGASVGKLQAAHITIQTNGGFRENRSIGYGEQELKIALRAGENTVEITCLDKPTISHLPNGDPRTLLLGIYNFTISGFNALVR